MVSKVRLQRPLFLSQNAKDMMTLITGVIVFPYCVTLFFFLLGSLFTEAKGLKKLLNLDGAKIISVKKPKPGLWKVTASSSGSHTLRITGLSSMYFISGFGLEPVKSQDEAMPRPVAGKWNVQGDREAGRKQISVSLGDKTMTFNNLASL